MLYIYKKNDMHVNISQIYALCEWMYIYIYIHMHVTLSVKTQLNIFFFCVLQFSTKYHPSYCKEHSVKM